MSEDYMNESNGVGNVKISNDVVSIIAGIAASEIKGVIGMSSGITGGITELLGMKNQSKGIKVELSEKEASVDIFLVMEYGSDIAEVGRQVQENVKDAIENMTGLKVAAVNVNVQGIVVPKEDKREPKAEI